MFVMALIYVISVFMQSREIETAQRGARNLTLSAPGDRQGIVGESPMQCERAATDTGRRGSAHRVRGHDGQPRDARSKRSCRKLADRLAGGGRGWFVVRIRSGLDGRGLDRVVDFLEVARHLPGPLALRVPAEEQELA